MRWSDGIVGNGADKFALVLPLTLLAQDAHGLHHAAIVELRPLGLRHLNGQGSGWNRNCAAQPFQRQLAIELIGIGAGADQEKIGLRSVACVLRSEEHTSEPQSLMRISYAVFCLKKKQIP